MRLFFLAFIFSIFAEAESQVRVGYFYEIGRKTEKYLFKQETKVKITDDLNRQTESTIWDGEGKVLMRETATIKDGVVINQVMEQLQIEEKYVLNVQDGKVTFETYSTKNSQAPKLIESSTEKIGTQFFTGPSLEVFLKKNLEQLKSQKKIKFDFGIFEFQKAISFEVKQTAKIFKDAPDLLPLKMQLSSLLSVFVDPLLLEIDPQTAMLRKYRGRTPVRILKKGKLEPFDGDIFYELKK